MRHATTKTSARALTLSDVAAAYEQETGRPVSLRMSPKSLQQSMFTHPDDVPWCWSIDPLEKYSADGEEWLEQQNAKLTAWRKMCAWQGHDPSTLRKRMTDAAAPEELDAEFSWLFISDDELTELKQRKGVWNADISVDG